MKGRKPDPKREKRGTGHRPAAGQAKPATPAVVEPAAASELAAAAPPADLPEVAAHAWRCAVEEMAGNRQLRAPDLVLLKTYCEAVYVHELAAESIHRHGLTVMGGMGQPIMNPAIRAQKDAAATIRQLSDVLGLNPLARIRSGIMQLAGQTMVADLRERLVSKIAKG